MGHIFAAGTREGVIIYSINEDESLKLYEIAGRTCLCVWFSNGG